MNINKLRKYTKLYKSAELMGASRILREYLGVDKNFPIPLSISHGVDMNHCRDAVDVHSVEPIHWSYNSSIHDQAIKVKPSVQLPHPWLILRAGRLTKPCTGVLVIGPPPGKSNDSALLSRLKELKIGSFDLLLKERGEEKSSRNFWKRNGVKIVSAGQHDCFFYDRLFALLEKYERVIGCTLSSALFYAAAIGRKCEIVENYTYCGYAFSNFIDSIDFNSPVAKKFALLLKMKKYSEASDMASELMGADLLLEDVNKLRNKIEIAIDGLQYPIHFKTMPNPVARYIILWVSMLFGKIGLIQLGFLGYFRKRLKYSVDLIESNEIDIWINGLNERNYRARNVRYIKNITEPGRAAD